MRWLLLLVGLSACLDGTDVEGKTYPCRKPEDCAEGFECDSARWVCVTAGTATPDGGLSDGGSPDAN